MAVLTATERKELGKVADLLDEAMEALRAVKDGVESRFDDLSEKAQEGERGQVLGEAKNSLTEIDDALDNAAGSVRSLAEG